MKYDFQFQYLTCSRSNVIVKSAIAKSARCSSSSFIIPSHSLLKEKKKKKIKICLGLKIVAPLARLYYCYKNSLPNDFKQCSTAVS